MVSSPRVWFVTGANSGFGLLLTRLALSKGETVIATARDIQKFPDDLRSHPCADLIEAQITAPENDITKIVDSAVSRNGRIDVLVNNAGFVHMGSTEEVTEAEARNQFDVNFFGLFNFSRAAIPHMRKQGSGIILQFSSSVGVIGTPGSSIYSASKFAVEGLAESMSMELSQFGIRVHIIEPGVFRTGFLDHVTTGTNISQKKDGYMDMGKILKPFVGFQPGDPDKGMQRVYDLVAGDGICAGLESNLRLPLGSDVMEALDTKITMLSETRDKVKEVAFSTDFPKEA